MVVTCFFKIVELMARQVAVLLNGYTAKLLNCYIVDRAFKFQQPNNLVMLFYKFFCSIVELLHC